MGTKKNQCQWTEDADGVWESACGEMFIFETDGPRENGFLFCPYCGRKLTTQGHTDGC